MFLLLGSGCRATGRVRECAPPCPESRGESLSGVNYRPTEPSIFELLANRLQGTGEAEMQPNLPMVPPTGKIYNILALSGGGKYGAFSAGVLKGWTESGTRPEFDLVTGVSTGSIVAVYAFLGSDYDTLLEEFYTTVSTRQILRRKSILAIAFSDSFASSAPLKQLIEKQVNDKLLDDIAAASRTGRRLLIGTTNLDTKRLVVWDLGAIAASDQPNKAKLFRDVILASASVPGEFPPVRLEITVNGKTYTEFHVDGGVTSEVFVRLAHLNVDSEVLRSRARPLAGSNVYAIIAGKTYADSSCVEPKLISILGNSVSALIYAMTQNDLLRIYTLALLTGMKFQYTALRQDFVDDGDALKFEPENLRKLFEEGRRVGQAKEAWFIAPPGILPHEQVVPRTGTNYRIPEGTPLMPQIAPSRGMTKDPPRILNIFPEMPTASTLPNMPTLPALERFLPPKLVPVSGENPTP